MRKSITAWRKDAKQRILSHMLRLKFRDASDYNTATNLYIIEKSRLKDYTHIKKFSQKSRIDLYGPFVNDYRVATFHNSDPYLVLTWSIVLKCLVTQL